MPIKKLDKDWVTVGMSVLRLLAISPKPGRYMSIEKGLRAFMSPRIKT